ncbi:uncharacterized protein [Polyergus mexicanus]|uniref:uncharacterized protein n=1 Tax=Polyergus mexicanus TaxID=615972 RepID=UPI0038B65299
MTLVLGGNYNEFIVRPFFNMVPIALINETNPRFNALEKFSLTKYSFLMLENYNFIHFLRKAHRFVLVSSSQPLLRSLLQRAKDSPWANPEGFYILIDKQTETRGCINARSYLWTAWEYDLLSVIFICIDPNDGIVYYTYNPYSNSTPNNWYEVGQAKGRNGHPWIILKRKFIFDSITCADLDFDKTLTLDGYEIRLNAVEMKPFIKVNLSLPEEDQFRGDNSEIIKVLLQKLKAYLLIILSQESIYTLGGIGPNGTFEGLMAPLSEGRIDIAMNTRILSSMWKVRYTYPHSRSGACVIAQPKKPISEFMKIVTFLSPMVMVGVIGICLLIYVIFTRSLGYIEAGLEVIRLMICVGILHLPQINSTRIFICMVLILFLNINALFQSHLSSLLTVPVYYRDIDSLTSLKKAGYTLYGAKIFKDMIDDPVLKSRYKLVSYKDCKEHVENSSTAVCVGDCYHMYYRIKGQDLIKSRMLIPMIQSYVTREDWPLYNRVNDIIQQMMQTGLIKKPRDDILLEIKREREKKIASKKKSFKVMLLKQLAFIFYILGFGYACAIIIFALEKIIGGSVPAYPN